MCKACSVVTQRVIQYSESAIRQGIIFTIDPFTHMRPERIPSQARRRPRLEWAEPCHHVARIDDWVWVVQAVTLVQNVMRQQV